MPFPTLGNNQLMCGVEYGARLSCGFERNLHIDTREISMARTQGGGWQLFGELAVLGLAAGATYYMHTQVEQLLDQILSRPFDDAVRGTASGAAQLDDTAWSLFRSGLERRATTILRARELLAVADQSRRIAPIIVNVLQLSEHERVRAISGLATDLDDGTWNLTCLVLAGLAEQQPLATQLLIIGSQLRIAIAGIDRTLTLRADAQRLALAQLAQSIDPSDWSIVLLALALRGNTNRDAERLLPFAKRLPEAHTICTRLSTLKPNAIRAELEGMALILDTDSWDALVSMLDRLSADKPTFRATLQVAHEILALIREIEQLIHIPLEAARTQIERRAREASAPNWHSFQLLFTQKARADSAAASLLPIVQSAHAQTPKATPALLSAKPKSRSRISTKALVPVAPLEPPPVESPAADIPAELGLELLRQSLRTALADQVITPEEGVMLEQLRRKLNITDETARRVFHEVRAEVT